MAAKTEIIEKDVELNSALEQSQKAALFSSLILLYNEQIFIYYSTNENRIQKEPSTYVWIVCSIQIMFNK